jgi:deazaflavin-dependent oxidoreductase (nitroreductase family)
MKGSRRGRLAAHSASLWAIKHLISPIDRTVVRVTGGRIPLPSSLVYPTLLLTTVGRRSGLPRSVPLMYVRDENAYVLANARPPGIRVNPWVLNLAAADRARIRIGTSELPVAVERLSGPHVDRLWPEIVTKWPALERFYRATGERWVFRLNPD